MEQYSDSPVKQFAQSRCFNHARREAAARCPSCKRFFCRECVSEHRNRLLCASCIAAEAARDPYPRQRYSGPLRMALRMMLGVLLLWMTFFLAGKALLAVPSAFHDHTAVLEDAGDSP